MIRKNTCNVLRNHYLLKNKSICFKRYNCIAVEGLLTTHSLPPLFLHESKSSYATLSEMKARMEQISREDGKESISDQQNQRNDKQRDREGGFHWDEFEHEFSKRKKRDWMFIAIFALPCIIVAQQGFQMLNQMSAAPETGPQNKYDDILTTYKKIFMDMELEEGKPLNIYALLIITFVVRKLIENVSFGLSNKGMLAQDESFIDKLLKIASICTDQNKTVRDDLETVCIQYLLNEIFRLTSLMAMSGELKDDSVPKLVDTSFTLLEQYSTDTRIMHMSPCLMSAFTLFELLKKNEFARSYFVEKGGISVLEKFIRRRAELKEKIKENLQAADEEAKIILQQMRMQQDVSKEQVSKVTAEKLNQNLCEGHESAAIAFILEYLSSFPEANQLIRNSYPCMKHLVQELDGLGRAAASAALIRLGVPENPKDRTPHFENLKLNLIMMNGSVKELFPGAKMAAIIFENMHFPTNSSQLIKKINNIIPEAEGTYQEHVLKSAVLQLLNQKEASDKEMVNAFDHPSGLGKTDPQVLLFMARGALAGGDIKSALRHFTSLQSISPKDPSVTSFLYQFCEEFQKQIMEDANLRNAIFSLDQYEACYKVKALLKAKN